MEAIEEDQQLSSFEEHCKRVFDHALSITNEIKPGHNLELKVSQVILQALDHLLAYSPENEADNTLTFDFFQHSCNHSNELKAHGLWLEENCVPSSTVLLQYSQIRDTQRKLAHQRQIIQRRNLLKKTIQDFQSKINVGPTNQEEEEEHHDAKLQSPPVTRRQFQSDARAQMKHFVHSFQSNIGSHSFLAGLRKALEQQIGHDTAMLWQLDAIGLTEAISVQDGHSNDYLDQSLEVLFRLFLLEQERDVETGQNSNEEEDGNSVILMLCIHPDSSDSFLRQILNELPMWKQLDARPAGILKVGTKVRRNGQGTMDEISKFDLWKDTFCHIL